MPQPRVVITGAGLISALGDSPDQFFDALLSGFSPRQAAPQLENTLAADVETIPILDFEPKSYLGNKNFRPLDRTGRFAVTAAHLALKNSGWDEATRQDHELGLALGTVFCGVKTIADFDYATLTTGPKYAKPMDFANTVINAAAGQTALWHKLTGVNSTIAAGSGSGLHAIGYAANIIRQGRADAMLAGGAEEICFQSAFGFQREGTLTARNGTSQSIPFGADRGGFALGEGAGFIVLESAESAAKRGAMVFGEIMGFATAYDSQRGDVPEAARNTMHRAITSGLTNATTEPEAISAVFACANGSPIYDQLEAHAIAAIFGGGVPVTATKGAHGEALGAGAAFQAIAALSAMGRNKLPGIAGFKRPENELPLTNLRSDPMDLQMDTCLLHATGYDGNSAALVLGRAPGDAR